MVVSGPGTIGLAMGFNYAIVGIIGAVVGAGVVGAAFLFLKKRGTFTAKVSEVVESSKELIDEV
jgi:hypothetical protein